MGKPAHKPIEKVVVSYTKGSSSNPISSPTPYYKGDMDMHLLMMLLLIKTSLLKL